MPAAPGPQSPEDPLPKKQGPRHKRSRRRPLAISITPTPSPDPSPGDSAPAPAGAAPAPGGAPPSAREDPTPKRHATHYWKKLGTLAQVQIALERRAAALLDAARHAEPPITDMLKSLVASPELDGARMHGLDYRIKGQPSLIRKVLSKWRQEDRARREAAAADEAAALRRTSSAAEHARRLDSEHKVVIDALASSLRSRHLIELLAQQADCLRYTLVLPEECYVEGVRSTLHVLEATEGIRRLKLKNFWRPETADR